MKTKKLIVWSIVFSYLISFLFFPIFAVSGAPGSTQKIPNAFWKLDPLYKKALKENNKNDIIRYGESVIALFKGMEETQQVLEIVTPRLEKVAKAYEALENYDKAIEAYRLYIPKAEKQGWKDGAAYAKSKLTNLDFDIQLYTKSTNPSSEKYLGAKYEPRSGAYFGSTYDMDPRINSYSWDDIKPYFPKKNAVYLTYLTWGQKAEGFDRHFQAAKQNGTAVQIGWNIDNSKISETLKNIENDRAYIEETAKYLKELDIPVFLRFASEMNIKENVKSPSDYMHAFRLVSTVMKELAPNVAMVWAPNDISIKGKSYKDFYPGDLYVDWVGISTYSYPYFQGKKNWGNLQDSIDSTFFTGSYVNPIAKLKEIFALYGNKKPIMISETGISHFAKLEKTDFTEWAAIQMKRLYIYGPMLYPELKGVCYFNVDNSTVTKYDNYALYDSPTINHLYNELVGSDYYLSDVDSRSDYHYEKITSFTSSESRLTLMTYTIVPKVLKPVVRYKVDGKIYQENDTLPYDLMLDSSKLPKGDHILSVEVLSGSKLLKTKQYQLVLNENYVTIKSK